MAITINIPYACQLRTATHQAWPPKIYQPRSINAGVPSRQNSNLPIAPD